LAYLLYFENQSNWVQVIVGHKKLRFKAHKSLAALSFDINNNSDWLLLDTEVFTIIFFGVIYRDCFNLEKTLGFDALDSNALNIDLEKFLNSVDLKVNSERLVLNKVLYPCEMIRLLLAQLNVGHLLFEFLVVPKHTFI